MAWLQRRLAVVFSLAFTVSVLAVDLWPPATFAARGLYLWLAVLLAAIIVGRVGFHWSAGRSFSPSSPAAPNQTPLFFAVAVGMTALAVRAVDGFPAGRSFITLPHWPAFYVLLAGVVVAAGGWLWLTGRDLRSWGLFAIFVAGGVNGQLFNLTQGGFALFFGLTAAVYLFQCGGIGTRPPRVSYVGFALIIFLCASFISLIFSQDWDGSFKTVFFLCNGFLIFTTFAREFETPDVLSVPPSLTWALALTTLSLLGAWVAKAIIMWRWIPLNLPQENLFWTMGISRNAIAGYGVAALPILFLGYRSQASRLARGVMLAAAAAALTTATLSLSKSSLLGLAVLLVLAFWYAGRERRMNVKLAAAATVVLVVLLLIVVAFVFPGGVQRFLNPLTYTTRALMLKVTAAALRQYPLTGVGLGSGLGWVGQAGALSPDELAASPEFLTGHGHSIILEIAGGMGVPGLLALAILVQTAWWAGVNLTKIDGDRFFFGMISASLGGVGAVLTVSLGLGTLSPLPLIAFAALAIFEGGIRRRGLPRPEPAWWHTVFVSCVLLASFIGLCHAAGARWLRLGDAAYATGDLARAADCYDVAGRFTPWSSYPRGRLIALRLERGDVGGAYDAARAAAGRAKGHAGYLERVGVLAWRLGDEHRARVYLGRAVEKDPLGLIGGTHQVYYALYLVNRGEVAGANALIAEAIRFDPLLARDPAFAVCDGDLGLRTVLRPIADRGTLTRLINVRAGVRGWERGALERRVDRAVPGSLSLEAAYIKTFRRHFTLERRRDAIARPLCYKLGQGYAEARAETGLLFPEIAGMPSLSSRERDLILALFPSPHRDVERHRWELQSLVGMALLANQAGKEGSLPEITAEFNGKAARVRRYVAGSGEPLGRRIARLRYYYLTDEQPEWDIELGDSLLLAGDGEGAYKAYARGLHLLLATAVAADDPRLDAVCRGLMRAKAFTEVNGLRAVRPYYFRKDNPAAYAAAAILEEKRGDYKRALTSLDDGARRFPQDVPLRLRLASFYGRRLLHQDRERVLSPPPEHPRLSWARAMALYERRDPKAETALAAAIRREPGSLVTYLQLTRFYAERGDCNAAATVLEEAGRHTPPSSLLYSRRGEVALAAGDMAGAEYWYRRARVINPYDLEPLVAWGEALSRQGRYDEARRLFAQATRAAPENAWGWLALAAYYRQRGDDTATRRVYEQGMAAVAGVALPLAYEDYLKRINDDQGRAKVLEGALRKDPTDAAVRARLGELELARGDVASGLRWLEEAVAFEPTNAQANAALGYYYRFNGRPALAVPYFEAARAAVPGPEGDNYKILLADAYIETGKDQLALDVLAGVTDRNLQLKVAGLRAKAYTNLGMREKAAAEEARASNGAAADPPAGR